MAKINLNTSQKVIPMCYAYSTPDIPKYNGWVKIGYTEKQDVDDRIKQQGSEFHITKKEEWRGNAIFEDGTGEFFTDHEFHTYLKKIGVKYDHEVNNSEWFGINGTDSKYKFYEFRQNRGILDKLKEDVIPYELREEQTKAVEETITYKNNHSIKNEFLWNCKPRFGKTLSAYDLMMKLNCHNTLIVTNRPAIANSWYSDYVQFVGEEECYFVSDTDALRGKPYVLSQKDFEYKKSRIGEEIKRISFVSLQDLKGSIYFGGGFDKLKYVKDTHWDLLIIDEAHEGVDTYKTDIAFDQITRNFTLHLSGTPFKALANDKFDNDAIYNWTYADEQKKKREWNLPDKNPYEDLPKLNLYTYLMSEIIKDEVEQGISINDEVEEYAFDLNEFFKTNDNGTFIHENAVDKFLDALTTQEKYPFSTEELRNEIKHSFWLLDRVASVKALEKKLKAHPIFKDYCVVIAAGDGKDDDFEETRKSFNKVKSAIHNYDKTITLSVGQLTTGITVPEWTAVLMLCNCKSPSLYMQAAFRSQNPCMFKDGTNFYRKENAYVFDFDPARTLIIFEEFANGLKGKTRGGGGTAEERKQNVGELLNFFPVIGEDESGEMVILDAEKVLSIPRRIKSVEVVKKGFMSNFLFENIGNIFNAPKEIVDILSKTKAVPEPKKGKENVEVPKDVVLDDDGNVVVDNQTVIGLSSELFGEKIYEKVNEVVKDTQDSIKDEVEPDIFDALKESITVSLTSTINKTIEENYSDKGLRKSETKQIERETKSGINEAIEKLSQNVKIQNNELEADYKKQLEEANNNESLINQIQIQYKAEKEKLIESTKQAITETVDKVTKEVAENAVKTAEKKIKEHKLDNVEDQVRDHLRGFTRTIPSFLMAFGDENTTLENFDTIVSNEVFEEVTRNISSQECITLDDFRKLRDGGIYTDEEGNVKEYKGFFDPIVFNDSIKEFMRKKEELSNYFDESSTEDIFDYIPPQKTNQIYTPKKVVKEMVDMLENENPECFDDDTNTFADLYMKSGLYIAEIVKRLYKSEKMKELHPDNNERLHHIFKKQVYGLAPTEIIYNIAKNFVLGFDKNIKITEHNLRLCDALPYAKEDTLEQKLEELFPELANKDK